MKAEFHLHRKKQNKITPAHRHSSSQLRKCFEIALKFQISQNYFHSPTIGNQHYTKKKTSGFQSFRKENSLSDVITNSAGLESMHTLLSQKQDQTQIKGSTTNIGQATTKFPSASANRWA